MAVSYYVCNRMRGCGQRVDGSCEVHGEGRAVAELCG